MLETGPPQIEKSRTTLPRKWDWFLLPGIAIVTLVVVSVATELTCRVIYADHRSLPSCLNQGVADGRGTIGKPNAVCWEKRAEMPAPVEYRFNSCGYRAGKECGPKPPGVYRIVFMGASMVAGLDVPQNKTFAADLGPILSQRTGRTIDIYDEGHIFGPPRPDLMHHMKDTTLEQPDLLVWVMSPLDVYNWSTTMPPTDIGDRAGVKAEQLPKHPNIFDEAVFMADRHSRAVFVLRNRIYSMASPMQYEKAVFKGSAHENDLMRIPLPAKGKQILDGFDPYAASIIQAAKTAGIPIVGIQLPNRVQAAMISSGEWMDGYDPYFLDRHMNQLFTSNGGMYLSLLPAWKKVASSEQYYYPVDGHPHVSGDAMIAGLIADQLTSGKIPELKAAAQPLQANLKEAR